MTQNNHIGPPYCQAKM